MPLFIFGLIHFCRHRNFPLRLTELLKGPIYHMFQVLKGGQPEVEFWNAAGRGKKTNEEWKQFFEGRGFRAGVDFPPSLFYE